jgi:hypothetical protein
MAPDYNVQTYIHNDRQWKREHRIAHAEAMLARAKDIKEITFWESILLALKD